MTPILYVGAPGVGKTAIVRSKYDHCEVLLLSSQTEEDIAGIPYRDGELEKRTVPPFIQNLRNATGTKCLFLDELDKARREVADTLLTLVTHPQKFGIPEGTDIIAAANPPEFGGGDGISQPMMNRFAVVEFTPDLEKWADYMLTKYDNHRLVRDLVENILRAKVTFLECNGEGLNWRMTSPRSIDAAVDVCINNPEMAPTLVPGLVTANMATHLLSLMRKDDQKLRKIQFAARNVAAASNSKGFTPFRG